MSSQDQDSQLQSPQGFSQPSDYHPPPVTDNSVPKNEFTFLGSTKRERLENGNDVHLHPSGSEGWLPINNTSEPQSQDLKQSIRKSPRKQDVSPVAQNGTANEAGLEQPIPTSPRATNGRSGSLARSGSKRSVFTSNEGQPVEGSAFIHGAGTVGPQTAVIRDQSLRDRAIAADDSLTPKQRSRIEKLEVKNSKKISVIIKQEGKVEKQALTVAIQELAELHKMQKTAIKNEAKAQANHARILADLKKHEAAFIAAKTRFETAQARINAEAEAVDAIRQSAVDATERMQEKSREIDSLRAMLSVDDREREVKLHELKGGKSRSNSMWR